MIALFWDIYEVKEPFFAFLEPNAEYVLINAEYVLGLF